MTDSDILLILKTDLIISVEKYDTFLSTIIELAKAAIQREGIVFNTTEESTEKMPEYSVEDGMLIEMYAAYLYRKRREEKTDMPRSLRYMLNVRLLSQKGSA